MDSFLEGEKMKFSTSALIIAVVVCMSFASVATADMVTINGFDFDLDQFDGAAVTYRADGNVDFDGKFWDQETGTDQYTLGELAAVQAGGDPGDQVTLQDTTTPDWLILTYGQPITVSPLANLLVIYEISSSSSGVDVEGLSFNVSLNSGSLISASQGVVTFFPTAVENSNQIVFDLYSFDFTNGDIFESLYIENINSGPGTSDPDFIFAGITSDGVSSRPEIIPEPATIGLLGIGCLALIRRRRKA
jgi:PEP-CTERM motif